MKYSLEQIKIGIIGLGYVGLPLAVEFGKVCQTKGFDINVKRVLELNDNIDSTLECTKEELFSSKKLSYYSDINDLCDCNIYIVTVPTPIDSNKQPDLSPLKNASKLVGGVLSKNDIVIYESTVYPGATEEDCIPILENISGLKYNLDFFAGYSPERINPGDKEHRVINIKKVTSGSTPEIADFVDKIYNLIIKAGTHKATSIKVAEASKVIENVQRDVNIALINELHHIFNKMNINTKDVIEAASTKWNFMKLMPGLVGGHCISVDPYYLLERSKSKGYIPDLIRTAREINDGMASFISDLFIKQLISEKVDLSKVNIIILGAAFKENCPDIRNTKIVDVYNELSSFGFDVDIYDPLVNADEFYHEYGLNIKNEFKNNKSNYAMLLVPHDKIIDEIKTGHIDIDKNKIFDFKSKL